MMAANKVMNDESLPFEIRRAFYYVNEDDEPEYNLWLEVAARVLLDAIGSTGLTDPSHHNDAVREARNWWIIAGDDMEIVAEYCRIDLKKLKPMVLKIKPKMRKE